jgi:hypothetical protein
VKVIAILAATAALAVSTPAVAQQTISFNGPSSSVNGSPDGNIRSFSNGPVDVQASAWSYNGSSLKNGWLGQYSHGLGVTDRNESGSNNSHTIDNSGYQDFVLLVFNKAVNVESAVLYPFSVGGSTDNDAWVSYADLPGAFTNPATPLTASSPLWAALAGNDYNVSGSGWPYSVSLNSGGKFGNVWLIGASNPAAGWTDRRYDGFKLSSVTFSAAPPPPPSVPEPATWAMMLLGFAASGTAIRRSRRKQVIVQIV